MVIPAIAQSEIPKQVAVKTQTAIVRDWPADNGRRVGTVKKDAVLPVYAYEPNTRWYLVKAGNVRGWIRESSVVAVLRMDKAEKLPDIPSSLDVDRSGDLEGKGWIKYATMVADGRAQYYHRSTMKRTGSMVRVWIKSLRDGANPESDALLAIDCGRRETLVLESIDYDDRGKAIKTHNFRDTAKPSSIPPNSMVFFLSGVLCNTPPDFY